MKKYIIKDSLGNKKIIYARNVVDTMKFIDSKFKDDSWKRDNEVYYKFERGYWHVLYIYNYSKMNDTEVFNLARKLNVSINHYGTSRWRRAPQGYEYYTDFSVKGKDKDNVIKFCEALNPRVMSLTFQE